MINNYYCNNYIIYTKSGSMTADGTYIYSGSALLSGSCRIDPVSDDEGTSTHKIFINIISLDYVDTIYVDGEPYEVTGINKFYNKTIGHHYELDAKVI